MKHGFRPFAGFLICVALCLQVLNCDHTTGLLSPYDSGLSGDTRLQNLALSDGEFDYPFNPYDWKYTVKVRNNVNSIAVTPTADHRKQEITVNGQMVESGTASNPININVGNDNLVAVCVKGEDATVLTYSVTVVRNAGETEDATLSGLSIEGVTTLTPAFDAASSARAYSVETDSGQIALNAAANSESSGASMEMTLNGVSVTDPRYLDLVVGVNTIIIAVTAADRVTVETYTLTALRRSADSDDAALSVLSIEGVAALTPAFDPDVRLYGATVNSGMVPIDLTATPRSTTATVSYALDGVAIADPHSIDLPDETNAITVLVTAGDGTATRLYTLTVTKTTGSTNARLSNIVITMGTNNSKRLLYSAFNAPNDTGFSSSRTSYAAVVYSFDTIHITATAEDSGVASIVIDGSDGSHTSGVKTAPVGLSMGYVTPVNIIATAQDGATTTTYTVNVKLLNVEEFYWGIYAPLMSNSFDRWADIFGDKTPTKTKTISGLVSGNLVWALTWVTLLSTAKNSLTLTNYKDGNRDDDGYTIRVAYNDNCADNAYNGFVVNGNTVGIINNATSTKDGTQTGIYTITTPWGDSIGSVDFHYIIYNGDKIVDPDSYVTFHYMGVDQVIPYMGSSAPYPFNSGFDWYMPWDDGL